MQKTAPPSATLESSPGTEPPGTARCHYLTSKWASTAARYDQSQAGRDIGTHSRKAWPPQEIVTLPPLGNKEQTLRRHQKRVAWGPYLLYFLWSSSAIVICYGTNIHFRRVHGTVQTSGFSCQIRSPGFNSPAFLQWLECSGHPLHKGQASFHLHCPCPPDFLLITEPSVLFFWCRSKKYLFPAKVGKWIVHWKNQNFETRRQGYTVFFLWQQPASFIEFTWPGLWPLI